MEFDKSKILTVVTADQAKGGQKGWVADFPLPLVESVTSQKPVVLHEVDTHCVYPFVVDDICFALFYPAPEPTYRPYNNDELNDLVGRVLINKQSGRRKVVTGKPTASEGVNLDGSYITAKDLLASFYRNGNKPCGVKDET